MAVPCIRRLVAGLSTRRRSFDLRPVHVGFVVDKVALRQYFLQLRRIYPVSTIQPTLH
jgi:hypothetical protein